MADIYKWGQYRTTPVTLGSGEDDTPELDVNGYLKVNVAGGTIISSTTVAISGGTVNAVITGGTVNALISTGDIEIGAVEIKNGTDDTRAVVGTAGADAVSNTQNELETNSRNSGYNGTTWDRVRVGTTTTSSTFTGYLNGVPYGQYFGTTLALTAGQGVPVQLDAAANQKITLGTTIAGEDITNDVLSVRQKNSYFFMTTASTITIKSGAGFFHGLFVGGGTASTIQLFDNTAGSGTPIMTWTSTNALASYGPFDENFSTGLTIISSAAANINISYS